MQQMENREAAASYERECPTCGGNDYTLFASERINPQDITEHTYSSRKDPEFMRLRLVTCRTCATVYAPSIPMQQMISQAYTEAAYTTSEEECCAAATYARLIQPYVETLPDLRAAVDIGAGCGALVSFFQKAGFAVPIGIEPSRAAVMAAPPEVMDHMRIGMFTPDIISDVTPSLVTLCMTIEHVSAPKELINRVYEVLAPGGLLAIAAHDRRAPLNRFLGLRSPIMDIEHLQLFCPKAIRFLLQEVGFTDVSVQAYTNTYPLYYWLRLLPIPRKVKKGLLAFVKDRSFGRIMCSIPVGNIFAVGRKSPEI